MSKELLLDQYETKEWNRLRDNMRELKRSHAAAAAAAEECPVIIVNYYGDVLETVNAKYVVCYSCQGEGCRSCDKGLRVEAYEP